MFTISKKSTVRPTIGGQLFTAKQNTTCTALFARTTVEMVLRTESFDDEEASRGSVSHAFGGASCLADATMKRDNCKPNQTSPLL